ncbi:hypothetical protein NLJ89_g11705 [Agrocybe chaxingu]|uniref:Transposase n=1 Tax=Agrocybe chaxingu TaxID=84603 RepID=A0A9W8JPI3_9AGAR|nr:hypothetical protein NLJ89_g11705 [Agrocybe chaxingu]
MERAKGTKSQSFVHILPQQLEMDNPEKEKSHSGRLLKATVKRKAQQATSTIRSVFKKKKKLDATTTHSDDDHLSPTPSIDPGTKLTAPPISAAPVSVKKPAEVIELDESEDTEEEDNSSEAELDRLKKEWISPIYAFFKPTPDIGYEKGRRYHEFRCAAKGCKKGVRRFLDKSDAKSTSNMQKHAKSCWGTETVEIADEAANLNEARKMVGSLKDGSITAAFERKGKGCVTYSHRQHTKAETKAEIVRWVAESARPFKIVADRGFLSLMKTGHPEYYVPSPSTVSHDVRLVFARSRQRISAMLRKHEGKISFATDAWTSPNHKAYVAVTAHLEHNGTPISLVLDVIELAKSHTGINLALAFVDILKDFGITDKVLAVTCDNATNNDRMIDELETLLPDFSSVNHTRCFLHVTNLVRKTLVKQFDVTKKAADAEIDAAEQELLDMAEGLDLEAALIAAERAGNADDGTEEEEVDDVDGWVDGDIHLTDDERARLEEDSRPVKLVIAKLRKIAFKIVHWSTLPHIITTL